MIFPFAFPLKILKAVLSFTSNINFHASLLWLKINSNLLKLKKEVDIWG